jgi:hypothetical protein
LMTKVSKTQQRSSAPTSPVAPRNIAPWRCIQGMGSACAVGRGKSERGIIAPCLQR